MVVEIEKPFHLKMYAFSHLHLIQVEVTIQLSSCLTMHHTMKACGGGEVWLHTFLNVHLIEVSGQLPASAPLPSRK